MVKLEWNEWNPFMFKKLTPFIKDDWTFVDVGSNHGEYVDFFKTFNYKEIYAFELNPTTANMLMVKYAGNPNIQIENYAVCDKDGETDFYDGGRGANDACHNIIGYNMRSENTDKLGKIKSIRLDTYFPNTKIDLMKIDVEGAEISVLHGLKSIIKNVGMILMECHLDNEWPVLRSLLLDDLNLQCVNFYDDTEITKDSQRPYQCLCRTKI